LKSKNVEVINDAGDIYEVPAENLDFAASEGFREFTPQVRKEFEAKKFAKDNPVLSAAAAAARGATIGLSDVALTQTGLADQDTLKAMKEEYPTLSTITEIGGAIAPALATGGTSLLARGAAKLPAAQVFKAGENVRKAIGAKIAAEQAAKGTTQNVIKEIAKKGLPLAGAGAIEGAIYGAGDLVSEAALGNAEFSAENLVSSIGIGGLLGGSIGFGLGASGAAIKASVDKGLAISRDKSARETIKSLDLPEIQKQGMLKRYEELKDLDKVIGKDSLYSKKELLSDLGDAQLTKELSGVLPTDSYASRAAFTNLMKSAGAEAAEFQGRVRGLKEKVLEKADGLFSNKIESLNEVGKDVVDKVGGKFKMMKEQANLLYDDFRNTVRDVPVTNKEFVNFSKDFIDKKLPSYTATDSKILKQELQRLQGNIRNFNEIYDRSTMLRRNGISMLRDPSKYELGMGYIQLGNALENEFADKAIRKLGLQGKGYASLADEARAKLAVAREYYSKSSDEIKKFQNLMGKKPTKSIAGIDGWLNEFEGLTKDPAAIAKALTKEKNPDLIKYYAMEHPEVFEAWKELQKYEMFQKSFTKKQGEKVFDASKLMGSIQDYRAKNPELAKMVISASEEKRFKKLSRIANLLKTDTNPSGTANQMQFNSLVEFLGEFINNPLTSVYNAAMGSTVRKINDKVNLALLRGDLDSLATISNARSGALANIADVDIKQTKKINSAARGFLNAIEKGSELVRKGFVVGSVQVIPYSKEELEKSEKVYRDLQSDPMKIVEAFQNRNPELNEVLPEVANAVSGVANRAISYLQDKIPPKRSDFFMQEYEPSRADIFKFAEYSEAVFDPDKVLSRMKSGYISPRQIEALEVVYPETVSALRQSIVNNIGNKKVTEAGKNFISLVLGVKTKPSLEPQNIQSLQSTFAGINQKELAQPLQRPNSKIKLKSNISKSTATGIDLALNRRNLD